MRANKPTYFDVTGRSDMTVQFYIGARGIGKTYSALRLGALGLDRAKGEKFLYLRRMASEIERVCTDVGNPFKSINSKESCNIEIDYNARMSFGTFTDNGETVGYATALSTFYGLRGIDLSDVTLIIFDEFISEIQRKSIKDEGIVFLNMIETVNRNRELDGAAPVKVMCFANAISLDNEILLELGVVNVIYKMIESGKQRYTDKKRGLYIEYIVSDISQAKESTALYRLAGKDSKFYDQAILNKFGNDFDLVKKCNIQEYKPAIVYGTATIYKHKTLSKYYVTNKPVPCSMTLRESDNGRLRILFGPRYRLLLASKLIFFDAYETKLYLDSALS